MERIAAGSVVTSSTIFSADTDDGMRGEITVDGDSTENAVCQVGPDRSGERDLPFISDLRAGSRYYEKYCEQRYDFLFHVFSEVYSRLLNAYYLCATPERAMQEALWWPRPPKRTTGPRRRRTHEYHALS